MTDFIAYSNQEAKPIKWTYTIEKLENKLEQRIKQGEEQKVKQSKQTTESTENKLKQNKEQNSKEKLKQKIAQKLENYLKERKCQNGELMANQNSDRISAELHLVYFVGHVDFVGARTDFYLAI